MTSLSDLIAAVAAASGQSEGDILSRSRRWPLPQCRWMVAERLMRQGMSENGAARMLRCNHSTIRYGLTQMGDLWHAKGYERERQMKERFNAIVDGDLQVFDC